MKGNFTPGRRAIMQDILAVLEDGAKTMDEIAASLPHHPREEVYRLIKRMQGRDIRKRARKGSVWRWGAIR